VNPVVSGVILAICAIAALLAAVHLVRDRPVEDGMYVVLAVLEVALLVQLVWAAVAFGTTDRDVSGVLFFSYLVGICTAAPIGAFWSLAERSRGGTAVLLVAILTIAALQARLWSIWNGAHA
jgi:flagellar biosynthesis protein FliR